MPDTTRDPQHPASLHGDGGRSDDQAACLTALGDCRALWEAVQRTSGEYIAVVDRSGIIRSCSRVDEGFTVDQVVDHNLTRFTLPESSERLVRLLQEVFETGEYRSLETTVRGLDGSLNYFSLRLGPVRVGGRIAAVMVCCENIRPLRTSEIALQRERTLLRRLLEIQERERQLVSYEIHDGLAQYLAGAMMHLEAYDHAAGESPQARDLREGLRLVRAATDEARRLISGLRPPALDELGIIEALETLVAEARLDLPEVRFDHALLGSRRLQADVETTIFRIVQESLANVRRHARATSVAIRLEAASDGSVRILIRDDGVGFDPAVVPAERFGLEGIRQRARLLGGEPVITSRPGGGTTIDVALPPSAAALPARLPPD
jgi:PAS domain S-box-containing protein